MKLGCERKRETLFNFNYSDSNRSIKLLLRKLLDKEIYEQLNFDTLKYTFSKTKNNLVVNCINKDKNNFFIFFMKKYRRSPNTIKKIYSKWELLIDCDIQLKNKYNPDYTIMRVFTPILKLGKISYENLLISSISTKRYVVIITINMLFNKRYSLIINKFPCKNNWLVRKDDPIKFFNQEELTFKLYTDPPKFTKVQITSNKERLVMKSI